jgi:hypothetical protein
MRHTRRIRLAALGLAVGLGAGCATTQSAPPPQSSVAAYPARGQTTEQQIRDSQDCAAWAQQQTGYSPAASTATGVGVGAAIGALGGAAAGAAIGAIAGDPGKGAAIGAVTGAVGGGAIGGTMQYAKSKDGYDKAYAACMSGRGYSVSR